MVSAGVLSHAEKGRERWREARIYAVGDDRTRRGRSGGDNIIREIIRRGRNQRRNARERARERAANFRMSTRSEAEE